MLLVFSSFCSQRGKLFREDNNYLSLECTDVVLLKELSIFVTSIRPPPPPPLAEAFSLYDLDSAEANR